MNINRKPDILKTLKAVSISGMYNSCGDAVTLAVSTSKLIETQLQVESLGLYFHATDIAIPRSSSVYCYVTHDEKEMSYFLNTWLPGTRSVKSWGKSSFFDHT